jgi:hypothetical protein
VLWLTFLVRIQQRDWVILISEAIVFGALSSVDRANNVSRSRCMWYECTVSNVYCLRKMTDSA